MRQVTEAHRQHHLKVGDGLLDESNQHYYGWVQQMLTVATGSLTLLVALQGSFVPTHPTWLWSLQLSWICWSLAIVCASTILWGRHIPPQKTALWHFRQAKGLEDGDVYTVYVPSIAHATGMAFPWLLLSAVVLLVLFAVMNVGTSSDAKGGDVQTQSNKADAVTESVPPT